MNFIRQLKTVKPTAQLQSMSVDDVIKYLLINHDLHKVTKTDSFCGRRSDSITVQIAGFSIYYYSHADDWDFESVELIMKNLKTGQEENIAGVKTAKGLVCQIRKQLKHQGKRPYLGEHMVNTIYNLKTRMSGGR